MGDVCCCYLVSLLLICRGRVAALMADGMVACSAVVSPGGLVDSAACDVQSTSTVAGNDTSEAHFAQERAFRIQLLDLETTRRELLWRAQMHASVGKQLWRQEQRAAIGVEWLDADDVAISAEVSPVGTSASSACSTTGLFGGGAECAAVLPAANTAKTQKKRNVPQDATCLACWYLTKTAREGLKPHQGNHAHTCERSRKRSEVADACRFF